MTARPRPPDPMADLLADIDALTPARVAVLVKAVPERLADPAREAALAAAIWAVVSDPSLGEQLFLDTARATTQVAAHPAVRALPPPEQHLVLEAVRGAVSARVLEGRLTEAQRALLGRPWAAGAVPRDEG